MLQFIFGKACSGKTNVILEKIKNFSNIGEESVLIVPEQFTFESEKAILKNIGDSAALNTTVLSFNRLYDEIGRQVGGISESVLSDAEKIIFMHRALNSVKDDLILWKKYVNSVSFAKTMLDTIGEFKINAVTVDDIKQAFKNAESKTLKYKLSDIAKIYEEYDILIREKFIDPADKLSRLYVKLLNYKYFENKNVFIDSFKDFTGAQFKIIECIFSQAKNVYITFTFNPKNDKEFGIFTNVKSNIEKIKHIAKSRAVKIDEPIVLQKSYYTNPDLSLVEANMSGESEISEKTDGIYITKAPSVYDEADFAAFKIRNLVREKGYRYRDFVVICRDADTYKEAFASACNKNEINLFYDNRLPLQNFPISVAVDSLINALDFSTENVLRFHKTGLGTLSFEEITTLENYLFIWNIKGDMWLKNWDMNPKGFITDELTEKELEQLKILNNLRQKAIEPIIKLKSDFNGNALKMATAIFKIFEEFDFSTRLKEMSEKFKADNILFSDDLLEQSYDSYLNVLDSIVKCFGEKSITKTEFYDALFLSVSLTTIGSIPQLLDQVTFGSADRIRPHSPKIAFILGANQGVFPKFVTNNGIFSLSERSILNKLEINVSDNSLFSAIDEEFLAYSNVSCPTESLYISYAEQSLEGTVLEASNFVNTLSNNINIKIKNLKDADINYFYSPETEKAAISNFCRFFNNDKKSATDIKNSLSDISKVKIQNIEDVFSNVKKSINEKTAEKLFGKNIAMSATRFDTINHCKFSYFCRYGLNINKLQSVEFDVMQKGTIVHFVLEKFINENSENLEKLTDAETDLLTEKYLNDYLDSVSGFRSVEDEKSKFLTMLILRSLKDVVKHVKNELVQSKFKPYKCEVKIGTDLDAINIKFPFSKGNIQLYGSIDRMDRYKGYIRIIDYKTGSKKFDLADILFGLNLQMLIYLYAVTRGVDIDDTSAAGILYQPASRDIKDEGLTMNGLLQNDEELLRAMESSLEGKFIPKVQINKDGTLSRRSKSFIDKELFSDIFDLIEKKMASVGDTILSGDIEVKAHNGRNSDACKYCDFASVCNFDKTLSVKVPDYSNEEIFEKIKEGEY